MGFAMIGFPSSEMRLSKNQISVGLQVHTSSWLKQLNFENYKNNVFTNDLRVFKKSDSNFEYNNDKAIIEAQRDKNDYIIWELKTIESLIQWIENVFSFYEITMFDIDMFKNQFERKVDISELIELKNNVSITEMEHTKRLSTLFSIDNDEFLLYVSILLYNDFVSIKEFLQKEYIVGLPNKKLRDIIKAPSFEKYFKIEISKSMSLNPDTIKSKFKNETGKRLAILIYLLDKKFDVIDYMSNRKTRIGFIRALKDDKSITKIQEVNNYLQSVSGDINLKEEDADMMQIEEDIKNCF